MEGTAGNVENSSRFSYVATGCFKDSDDVNSLHIVKLEVFPRWVNNATTIAVSWGFYHSVNLLSWSFSCRHLFAQRGQELDTYLVFRPVPPTILRRLVAVHHPPVLHRQAGSIRPA